MRNSGESVPLLMEKMAQIIEDARAILPAGLQAYVPEDSETLRRTIAEWLRSNAGALQLAGRGIGRSAGARAHGHDHRRAALDAEGGATRTSGARSPSTSCGMPRASPPRFSAWCSRSSGFR